MRLVFLQQVSLSPGNGSPGGGGGEGGIGGDTAAVLPGLKLGTPFFFSVLMWTIHMSGSYRLISQAGWNRCNLVYYSTWSVSIQDLDWLTCTVLLSCDSPRCFVDLLPWLILVRVFAGQCCDVRVLHPYSLAATFCLLCIIGFARACPGSTCISL